MKEEVPEKGGGKKTFRAATYNVHRCIGLDGRLKPERIALILRELNAPIVGLQEVDHMESDTSQAEYLAEAVGLVPIVGPATRRGKGYFGNVLLTGYPILNSRCVNIGVRAYEPRNAIDALLDVDGAAVRVISTHLGLAALERRRQVRRLLEICSDKGDAMVLVLGDTNEWAPFNSRSRTLDNCLGKSPAPRSFPSFLPMFALDRIWVRPRHALHRLRVHKTRFARVASDHLPVLADIYLPDKNQRDR